MMKIPESLSVFFMNPTLCRSLLFWTCECFQPLICFTSCPESNDALLLEISLISFFIALLLSLPWRSQQCCLGILHSISKRAPGPPRDLPKGHDPALGVPAKNRNLPTSPDHSRTWLSWPHSPALSSCSQLLGCPGKPPHGAPRARWVVLLGRHKLDGFKGEKKCLCSCFANLIRQKKHH